MMEPHPSDFVNGLGEAVEDRAWMASLRSYLQVFSFDMASKALLAGTTILLIRYMPAEEFAEYTFALSVCAVIAQTISASINRVYIIGVEGDIGPDTDFASYLGAQLWGGLILTVLVMPLSRYTHGLFAWIVVLSFGSILSEFAKTYYQRRLAFFRLSLVEVTRASIFAGAVAALASAGRLGAVNALVVQAGAMLIISIAVFRHASPSRIADPRPALQVVRAIVSGPSLFVVGYFVLIALLPQVSVFALQAIRPDEVGTFGSAFRYYALLLTALNTAHVVLLPTVKCAATPNELEAVFGGHRRVVALFALAVLASAAASPWIIPAIDHGRYPGAVPVFQILAVSAVISFTLSPHINVLLAARQFRFVFWLMAAATGGSVVVTPPLVWGFRAIGAAVANLIIFGIANGILFRRSAALRSAHRRTAAQKT